MSRAKPLPQDKRRFVGLTTGCWLRNRRVSCEAGEARCFDKSRLLSTSHGNTRRVRRCALDRERLTSALENLAPCCGGLQRHWPFFLRFLLEIVVLSLFFPSLPFSGAFLISYACGRRLLYFFPPLLRFAYALLFSVRSRSNK